MRNLKGHASRILDALFLGRKCEEIEDFINSGVYQVDRLKEEGWITNILYDDEVQLFS